MSTVIFKIFKSSNNDHLGMELTVDSRSNTILFKGGRNNINEQSTYSQTSGNNNWRYEASYNNGNQKWFFNEPFKGGCNGCGFNQFIEYKVIWPASPTGVRGPGPGTGTGGNTSGG